MASERIPACASYRAINAAPHLAKALQEFRRQPETSWQALLDQFFESARASLDPARVQAILGSTDDGWVGESYAAAVGLCSQALTTAVKNQATWDQRKTARTRRGLIVKLANDHIRRWMEVRGMDVGEAARLRDGGGS